jgi:hypothetical protein
METRYLIQDHAELDGLFSVVDLEQLVKSEILDLDDVCINPINQSRHEVGDLISCRPNVESVNQSLVQQEKVEVLGGQFKEIRPTRSWGAVPVVLEQVSKIEPLIHDSLVENQLASGIVMKSRVEISTTPQYSNQVENEDEYEMLDEYVIAVAEKNLNIFFKGLICMSFILGIGFLFALKNFPWLFWVAGLLWIVSFIKWLKVQNVFYLITNRQLILCQKIFTKKISVESWVDAVKIEYKDGGLQVFRQGSKMIEVLSIPNIVIDENTIAMMKEMIQLKQKI